MPTLRLSTCVLLALTLFAASSAAQTTYTWNGANPGDWAVASNWSPSGVPGAGDAVVIGTGQPVLHDDATVADIAFSGGMLSGDGNLMVTGTFTWTGGTLNGRDYAETAALTLPAGATLLIAGEADKVLRGRDIFNDGTIRWEGPGRIVVAWGTRIENRADATFDLRSDATWTRTNGTCILINDGLFVKSAGEGTTSINYPFGQFVNQGIVRVEVGTLMLNNGSSFSASGDGVFEIASAATLRFNQAAYSFGAGSVVRGAGTLLVTSGSARLGRGDVTGPTVIAGGTLAFTDTETPTELADVAISGSQFSGGRLGGGGVVNVNGLVTWSGGYLGGGGGVFNLRGGVSAEGEATKYFNGGTLNNADVFAWSGTGNLVISTGTAFNNLEGATIDIQNDAVWTRSNGSFTFVNRGLVRKAAGEGTTTIDIPFGPFNNDGEFRVEAGTLYVRNQGTSTDAGEWVVEDGALLRFNLHQRTFSEAASLSGTGTVEFAGGTIVNRGTVRPGLSVGTLTVQGNLPAPQAAGALEIELGEAEHDVLDVTNIANLGGVLRLALADGFEPTGDEAFTVVTALAVQGAFAEVVPPDGYVAEVTYGAQDVTVRVVPVLACAEGLAPDEHTVALYKFDEPLPGTSFDASGHGLDAVDTGTEVTDGRFCSARRFNGTSDRIDMDVVRDSLQGATAWTLEYVARSEDGSQMPYLMNHACGNGWALRPSGSSVGYWIKTTGIGGNCPWFVQGSAVAELDTLWHYYALTWDGDSLRAYRDGTLLGSEPATGVFLQNQSSSFRAWIGHDDFSGAYHPGLADDLRISDVARSGDEIYDTAVVLGFAEPPVANEGGAPPARSSLHAPYPNPTSGRATLAFDLAEAGPVRLVIYDVLGRTVAVLMDEERPAGRYEAKLDGREWAAGLYLARLHAGTLVDTRRVVVNR